MPYVEVRHVKCKRCNDHIGNTCIRYTCCGSKHALCTACVRGEKPMLSQELQWRMMAAIQSMKNSDIASIWADVNKADFSLRCPNKDCGKEMDEEGNGWKVISPAISKFVQMEDLPSDD